jgi:valyl-tRNA synthetase
MTQTPLTPDQKQKSTDSDSKAYDPKAVDTVWYTFWKEHGFFHADPQSDKKPFCIVMPPPNVTGALHMGHALVSTLQDILIRWKRMLGFEALWVPGTDHAGIATQTVVERHLIKTQGKRRKDFSREEFLDHVWKWKNDNEHRIIGQLKQLGCSCDWERQRFTMDTGNNRAVRAMFKKLYDDGLIYRGDYLVNWDPVTQTALADDEVEYEDNQGFLWHLRYPLADGSDSVTVATTRPETMLGDTAVAVSPKDPRYSHLVGKEIRLPLTNRIIPIIADPFVDPSFGTGLVKVTPAHDPNDYQMGMRHHLPFINIMTPDGKINENGGEFQGLSMEEARQAVVEALKTQGFVSKIEPHINRIGVSYRSKAVIQPYMSKQWFIKMDRFGDKLRTAVREDETKLIPKNWESVYFYWIDNLRDWCISRQLWWGHRIPIWYRKEPTGVAANDIICWDGDEPPPEVLKAPNEWVQDEDVLDTWFSSALWPFSTLGWPEKTPELDKFYPNAVLITGHDILFFWVARMMMMGHYAMGKEPFPETFLHGLIYGKSYWREAAGGGITYVDDKERLEYDLGTPTPKGVLSKWEKMSKSKGNIIDPLEMIDQFGTDAVRMALCASATQARQIDLDRRRFAEFKNFANKVWNGARFVFMNLEGDTAQGLAPLTPELFAAGLDESLLSLEDRWILSTMARNVQEVNHKLTNYLFDQAALEAYDFFWNAFCANYVEIVKPILFGKAGTPAQRTNKQRILAIVLCTAIRLLHPMAPFITEELFQRLKSKLGSSSGTLAKVDPYTQEAIKALNAEACIVAPYPLLLRKEDLNSEIEAAFDLISRVVYTIRNIRGEMKLPPGALTDIYIIASDPSDRNYQTVDKHRSIIEALVRAKRLDISCQMAEIGFASSGMVDSLKVIIPMPEESLQQEKARLIKEQDRLTKTLTRMRDQLQNREFLDRAPPDLIEKQKLQLAQSTKELEEVESKLKKI